MCACTPRGCSGWNCGCPCHKHQTLGDVIAAIIRAKREAARSYKPVLVGQQHDPANCAFPLNCASFRASKDEPTPLYDASYPAAIEESR